MFKHSNSADTHTDKSVVKFENHRVFHSQFLCDFFCFIEKIFKFKLKKKLDNHRHHHQHQNHKINRNLINN